MEEYRAPQFRVDVSRRSGGAGLRGAAPGASAGPLPLRRGDDRRKVSGPATPRPRGLPPPDNPGFPSASRPGSGATGTRRRAPVFGAGEGRRCPGGLRGEGRRRWRPRAEAVRVHGGGGGRGREPSAHRQPHQVTVHPAALYAGLRAPGLPQGGRSRCRWRRWRCLRTASGRRPSRGGPCSGATGSPSARRPRAAAGTPERAGGGEGGHLRAEGAAGARGLQIHARARRASTSRKRSPTPRSASRCLEARSTWWARLGLVAAQGHGPHRPRHGQGRLRRGGDGEGAGEEPVPAKAEAVLTVEREGVLAAPPLTLKGRRRRWRSRWARRASRTSTSAWCWCAAASPQADGGRRGKTTRTAAGEGGLREAQGGAEEQAPRRGGDAGADQYRPRREGEGGARGRRTGRAGPRAGGGGGVGGGRGRAPPHRVRDAGSAGRAPARARPVGAHRRAAHPPGAPHRLRRQGR